MAVNKQCSTKTHLARSLVVDDELRDLEIDGYKIVFTRKVALLPIELTDIKPTEGKKHG